MHTKFPLWSEKHKMVYNHNFWFYRKIKLDMLLPFNVAQFYTIEASSEYLVARCDPSF